MRQIPPGSLGTRSPDPAQLSSLRVPGAQDPAGPKAHQATQSGGGGGGVGTMDPHRQSKPLGCRGSDGREILPVSGGAAVRAPELCRTQPPACPPGPPSLPARSRWEGLEGLREKASTYPSPHSPLGRPQHSQPLAKRNFHPPSESSPSNDLIVMVAC